MRVGLTVEIHGDHACSPAPRWTQIRRQARAAEDVGFDLVALPDALFFGQDRRLSMWESTVVAGAIAAATETIGIAHSVVNTPLRHPALIAKTAETLDEISQGRYTLGIGAGDTTEDYRALGIPAGLRYSRFAESTRIIHELLRRGYADFEGEHHSAINTRFHPRGPRPSGPPIVMAAAGPRMLALCARYADGWNWGASGPDRPDHLDDIIANLDHALEVEGRDPATLQRSLDVASVDVLGVAGDRRPGSLITGTPDDIAATLATLTDFGINEVRIAVAANPDQRPDAVATLTEVVSLLHAI